MFYLFIFFAVVWANFLHGATPLNLTFIVYHTSVFILDMYIFIDSAMLRRIRE